jgi:hypothetical protein
VFMSVVLRCWELFNRLLASLRSITRNISLASLYFLEVVVLGRRFH